MQNRYIESKGILKAWLWVILCSFGIFVVNPVVAPIIKYIGRLIGKENFGYIALFLVSVFLAALFHTLIFKAKIKRISQYFWLIATAAAFIFISLQLLSSPADMLHILDYSLLSYLLYRALSHLIKDNSTIYITSAMLGMFIGTIDEFIQWMLPGRVFDFRDIGLNFLICALSQIAIWKGIKPKHINKPIEKKSINILAGIITVNIFFLLLCFSNTPNVVYRYTSIIRPLSWLNSEEPMNEFGYRYNDPEIGVFYSRLSLDELKKIDFLNRKSNGNILSKDISADSNYSQFLRIYNPSNNPFLHELRVHLFRRDKNLERSLILVNTKLKVKASYIAIKENLIAEKYFGNTLRQSKFYWSKELIEHLTKMAASWDKPYRSPVSSNVIISITLKTVWETAIFFLIIIWIFVELWKRQIKT